MPASPPGSKPEWAGGSLRTRTNLAQEWRTPPLWGVADSPPYLHDGRAYTLEDAIRLHDGEAEGTVALILLKLSTASLALLLLELLQAREHRGEELRGERDAESVSGD